MINAVGTTIYYLIDPFTILVNYIAEYLTDNSEIDKDDTIVQGIIDLIIIVIITFPGLLSAIWFCKWIYNDNENTRRLLKLATIVSGI